MVLDPAVYPHFDLYNYGTAQKHETTCGPSNELPAQSILPNVLYPAFNLCEYGQPCQQIAAAKTIPDPAVYPHFDLYSAGSAQKLNNWDQFSLVLPATYPAIVLCKSTSNHTLRAIVFICVSRCPCLPTL